MFVRLLLLIALLTAASPALAAERVLDGKLHHLRQGGQREWSDFPEQAEGPHLVVRFRAEANAAEHTLRLRQQDVKQTWKVLLNGAECGRLTADENDLVVYFPVPAGALATGENTLRIEQVGTVVDDVRVGEFGLDDRPLKQVLSEATVEVRVADADHPERPLPCRLTVLTDQGSLMTVGAASDDTLAVRPGVVYTSNGRATFGLPAGNYSLVACRGFAWSIARTAVALKPGDRIRKDLAIRQEVVVPGYVVCDPHVHTLTHSGHGDCTLAERMLTLAGEGVELPVATDHNKHIDYQATAEKLGVRKSFTPVIGNEVTTAVGHFCVFPVSADAEPPDWELKDWKGVFDSIADRTAARVVILNHGRDLHSNYRALGPQHFNAVTGRQLDGWELRANAMEVVNSGALQTDPRQLYRDWFALLNRGCRLAPVGSSDSHDVGRYIVGQGRTYVRARGDCPGSIDVNDAVSNFAAGRVMVSLGLLAEITVNDKYGPGDLAPGGDAVKVRVRVLGPSWVTADRVELYANGRKIHEAVVTDGAKGGVKWSGEWTLPRGKQDVHLAAVAFGPGVRELYWPIAKPYQPTAPEVNRYVIGSTGAVWVDFDGDGTPTSAYEYARRLVEAADKPVAERIAALAEYDETVAAQAAERLHLQGVGIQEADVLAAAKKAGPQVERGFQAYFEAWRQCQLAREPKP